MGKAPVLIVALAALFVLADGAVAQSALALTSDRGMIGDLVRGGQPVTACTT